MKFKFRSRSGSIWSLTTITGVTILLLLLNSVQSIRIREGGGSREAYEADVETPQVYRRKLGPSTKSYHIIEESTSPVSPTDLLLHYYGHTDPQRPSTLTHTSTQVEGGLNKVGQIPRAYEFKPKPKTVILSRSTYQPSEQQGQPLNRRVQPSPRGQEQFDDDDEVEDETDYPYNNNNGGQESAETTTISSRLPLQIPPALRRNFGQSPRSSSSFERGIVTTTTIDTPTDNETIPPFSPVPVKSSRKKNKNKSPGSSSSSPSTGGGRRRKIKRPVKIKEKEVATASALKATVIDGGDLEEKSEPGVSSNSTGEKNLALEIGSDDGKYALIDSFFNQTEVQQPGILSYKPSDDFPSKDNEKTLGNLNQNEIWLSEGHLLVLKGGEFDATNKEVWPPIDNFQRKRKPPPLKIPLDTDNPPPFPIFVNDSGPPIFLREPPPFLPYPPPGFLGNDSNFDPSLLPPPGLIPLNPNGTIPQSLGFPPGGFGGGPLSGPPPNGGGLYGPRPGGVNSGVNGGVNGNGGFGVNGGVYGQGGGQGPPGSKLQGNQGQVQGGPPPFYPFLPPPPGQGNGNGSFPPPPYPFPPPGGPGGNNGQNFPPPPPGYNQNFNGSGPPPGFPFLPPLVLNPADNETDDPSIFLPPPYDFDYYEDNSTLVPPGPFAPGLVVPPPKDFYSVYNRTGKPSAPPPIVTTTYHFFPTTSSPPTTPGQNPTLTSPSSKKQRPNGKKPKFPITNPPDDSLEELYPIITTPFPIPETTPSSSGKKRKRPKTKKPFFPSDGLSPAPIPTFDSGRYNSQESSDEEELPPNNNNSNDHLTPVVTFPPPPPPSPSSPQMVFPPSYKTQYHFNTSPRPNVVVSTPQIFPTSIPTYRVKTGSVSPPLSSTSTTPTTTTTTTKSSTTSKPTLNSFVYVQGRLTTLEEIAAEQAAEEEFDHHQPGRISTPRPPFDSRGYPTRILEDENNGNQDQPLIFEFPKKTGRKPTETPLKAFYPGTPKYDPNYRTILQNPQYNNNNNQGQSILVNPPSRDSSVQQQSQPPQQPPTILYPSTVYTNGRTAPNRVRGRHRNNQRLNNNPSIGNSVPIYIDPQTGNGYYSNQGNLVNIGPTYVTQTQQQQSPPQSQINFVEKQPQQINPYNSNNRPSVIVQSNPPNYLPPSTQLNNGGFRPALPPPVQPQQQQINYNLQQQSIYGNQQRGNNRARVLFPGQVAIQQLTSPPSQQQQQYNQQQFNPDPSTLPIYSHSQQGIREEEEERPSPAPEKNIRPRPTLKTFAPQGYYSPITKYQVDPTPTSFGTPFIPSQYYSQQQEGGRNVGRGGQQFNYPSPVSVSNFQSDPTIPSTNYNIQGGEPIQVYQPNYPQSSQNNRAFSPQRLNTQQFIQPLYDDLRINYREPIPQYNEESESVTTRSVIKAGPGNGVNGDKLSSESAPGTFYSFQRGGVGGFSYKIRL